MIGSGSYSRSGVGAGSDSVLPVALVIPVKNEAANLPELFAALERAPAWPAEIIFTDAGSTDGTQALLRNWAAEHSRVDVRMEIVERPGAFPGGGRNAGIAAARAEWIAFVDGGIRPEPDFLSQLHACASAGGRSHAFGWCRFDAVGVIPLAVCALTNGVGGRRTVLPAAMFHRSVFERIGCFPEHLRSAEDLVWLKSFEMAYCDGRSAITAAGSAALDGDRAVADPVAGRLVCDGALVHYTHYPASLGAILCKWFTFERSSVAARAGGAGRAVYLGGAIAWLAMALFSPGPAVIAFVAYVTVRGVLDPIRRSRNLFWWRGAPLALLAAPVCALCIDAGKVAGAVACLVAGPPLGGAPRRV